MPMAYCRVLLCNLNKKSVRQDGNFLFISNKHLVTFHFPLAIYHHFAFNFPDLSFACSQKAFRCFSINGKRAVSATAETALY